jgi:hypothetical protein
MDFSEQESAPQALSTTRKKPMKLSGFVMSLFTFLLAWFGLAAGGWSVAQNFAEQSVMPWAMRIISQSYEHATSVVGASIAILGGLLIAIVLAVVVLSLVAAAHRVKNFGKAS